MEAYMLNNLEFHSMIRYKFPMPKKLFFLISISIFLFTSCSKRDEVPKSLEEMLKSHGVQEIQLDLNYQSPEFPDKKYVSLTATYNFATAEGKPQREFLGYILKREGQDWKVDRNVTYTKNEQKAKVLLSGGK
jgi:hypothetical protein